MTRVDDDHLEHLDHFRYVYTYSIFRHYLSIPKKSDDESG
jgi:hypothetical protein